MPGTWSPLTHQPAFGVGTMLLLTDGTVMCQNSSTNQWWRLTPDITGSYTNGTWTELANGPNAPLYFASAVLRDGRVFVAGGEYNNGVSTDLLAAEIFDPKSNTWSVLSTPPGWTNIGDAPCCVFPDGRIMIGSIENNQCAVFDPATNSWASAANKHNNTSTEETWTLLPDQTILTADCSGHPQTEKYVIAANQWLLCGNTPTDLVEASSIEIGPALLLPDGRVFAVGATGRTALYTMPPVSNQAGTWTAGPSFPPDTTGKTLGAKDAPGCLLPNGLVLCAAGPVDGVSGDYLGPTHFFEFDPVAGTLNATSNPPTNGGPPYVGRFLLVPSGQVLFANGSSNLQVYTPTGSPDPTWKPNIVSVPKTLWRGGSYALSGRQINGLSQCVSYGDDATMATNYPIVRITSASTGHVFYCRTFNHSTMGVNTGTVIHHTEFTVPVGVETGAADIVVIANGIPSNPVRVAVVAIKLKEVKEIKAEIKEIKERDILDVGSSVAEAGSQTADPVMQEVIKALAERVDQLAAQAEQLGNAQPFIQSEERPEVGAAAIRQYPPPSKAKK